MNRIWCFVLLIINVQLYADEKIMVPLDHNNERHIVVVIASYNNKNYYRQNLGTILDQSYSNYHIIYIDDCSTDGTYELVKTYIHDNSMENKVLLIRNEKRQGALCNQYNAIHSCRDTDLIIILDGDDWLADNQVFAYVNSVYSNQRIWLTYGQFVQYPTKDRGWCVAMPDNIVKNNEFRNYVHAPGHLRTFYAGLFKQIQKEDLCNKGDFFRMSGDIAAMFPMIEMAREGHFQFISKVLMIYNIGNPINDHKVVEGLQRQLDIEIRSRRKYDPIATPFLSRDGGIESAITV